MLSRESFMLLPEVVRLANDGLVIIPDIEELWDSFVGDADGVSQDEAYELLCMVHDLPDPEDMQYYEDQFALLATGNTMVAFRSILMWSDVRELIDEGAITESELKVLYNRAVKQASEHGEPTLTIAQFRIFNRLLDDLLDEKEVVSSPSQEISTPVEDSGDIDAWSSTFDPLSVLDEEMVDEYTEYFLSKTESKTGSLSKQEFMSWSDIQELLTEGSITEELLEQAWTEAAGRSKGISFDRFLRLNVRLDILMDDEFPETETVTADSISTAGQ